jgi:hypothetical protein
MKYIKAYEDIISSYDIAWKYLSQKDKDVFKFKIDDIIKIKNSNPSKLYKIIALDTDNKLNMSNGQGAYFIRGLKNVDNMMKVSGSIIEYPTEMEIDANKYNL